MTFRGISGTALKIERQLKGTYQIKNRFWQLVDRLLSHHTPHGEQVGSFRIENKCLIVSGLPSVLAHELYFQQEALTQEIHQLYPTIIDSVRIRS